MAQPRGDPRVKLTRSTRAEDFRDFYWLKLDLQDFCREHGLSTSGGKREIADRIEHFLRTGQRLRPVSREPVETESARRVNAAAASTLTMRTHAPAGFRCSQQVRLFFQEHLGKNFRFTVTLQKFIKQNPGVTFGQIAKEWERQEALKRTRAWKPSIAPQFEYNQFTRDYHADPRNEGKTRDDCIEAWNRARARRGDHKYRPEDV